MESIEEHSLRVLVASRPSQRSVRRQRLARVARSGGCGSTTQIAGPHLIRKAVLCLRSPNGTRRIHEGRYSELGT
jgi:hypothetical protein